MMDAAGGGGDDDAAAADDDDDLPSYFSLALLCSSTALDDHAILVLEDEDV